MMIIFSIANNANGGRLHRQSATIADDDRVNKRMTSDDMSTLPMPIVLNRFRNCLSAPMVYILFIYYISWSAIIVPNFHQIHLVCLDKQVVDIATNYD
jgi:hypothetical protein